MFGFLVFAMLKYVNTGVVFQEIPDEITLAINLSNCPCRCPGCHSMYLWEDVGKPLTEQSLDELLRGMKRDITCVAFMGGDAEPEEVNRLACYLHCHYPAYKVAWYSGRIRVPAVVNREDFDYIKTGPYIRHLGGLRSEKTNQRLYKRTSAHEFTDITHLLRKR